MRCVDREKEEKLTQEKREALAARVKYDAAVKAVAEIEAELHRCETELDALRDLNSTMPWYCGKRPGR